MLNANWIGKLAFKAWDKRQGGHRLAELARLHSLQYETPEVIAAYQQKRLNKLLQHAWNSSPWYREILADLNYSPNHMVDDTYLKRLPITRKQHIRDNLEAFISDEYDQNQLRKAKTGGSTGVSLNLYFDERCQQWRNAAQMYADELAGWNMGDRVAAIWGNPPVHTTLKQKLRSALLERMIYLDTMDINPDAINRFVEKWNSYQPTVIFGHAHSIYILADYLQKNAMTPLRPKGVVATSMMLLDHERQVIESAFACKVTNRYGCEEVGLIAVECEKHNGMHLNTPHLIVEVLRPDGSDAEPDEPGKIVVTDLNNYGMPLIRYQVEDVGVLSNQACSCGRHTPLLKRLEGRVADFLKKPDGGQVAGVSLVERTLTKVPGVAQMQLVQDSLSAITINRVKGSDFSHQTDQDLLMEFRQVFPESVKIIINDVDRIPQEASGKYRFSICRI